MKKMITINRVVDAINQLYNEYGDGLISSGQFTQKSISYLSQFREHELKDCCRVIQDHEATKDEFDTLMKEYDDETKQV